MKRSWILVMGVCALWHALVGPVHADFVITSNIGEPINLLVGINTGSWVAQSFTTDTTSYTLSSITVVAVGSGSGFTLSLYSNNSGQPGSLIDTLMGSPTPSEATTYLPSMPVLLNASTTYFAVAKATSGNFEWRFISSTSQTGPGLIGDTGLSSSNSGSSWNSISHPLGFPNAVAKLGVEGTAVPEASAVLCLGLICVGVAGAWGIKTWRRRLFS